MVDLFALALSHALLALAAWRLVLRDDLDTDNPVRRPVRPARTAPGPEQSAAGQAAAGQGDG